MRLTYPFLTTKGKPRRTKRGRDEELVNLRNQALCRRFYYWSEIKRLRIDDVFDKLSREEFFLSEQRIMVLLRENSDILSEIHNARIKTNQLNLFE